ncbi:hypothetical protein HDU96_004309 [Phlyctochytrium bullatum]|nr:hypothetical protein HDU96_004309 [Phlyctochytrium bullatum]
MPPLEDDLIPLDPFASGMPAALKSPYIWHSGEKEVQARTQSPLARFPLPRSMPEQHQLFFSNLAYFAFATLDAEGRPWSSILVGSPGFVRNDGENVLHVDCMSFGLEPTARNLADAENGSQLNLIAGLGIDFTNRRRNKVAGNILASKVTPVEKAAAAKNGRVRLQMQLLTTQSLGNCPKYITVRDIKYSADTTPTDILADLHLAAGTRLPQECIDHIHACDTTFLATRHTNNTDEPDMDCNHRGGPPGFVRVGADGASIHLPDYSGNRLFQSLGNIATDKLAGMAFPDFATGHMLYVTGKAENLFDDEAQALMPRVSRLTRIQITGYVFAKHALGLTATRTDFSPYNPPVRYMAHEPQSLFADASITARIVKSTLLSADISTFDIELAEPVLYKPGQYAIFDFSQVLRKEYRHMADEKPGSLNDDLLRTWTITSFPPLDAAGAISKTNRLSITVKRKEHGLISGLLHHPEYMTRLTPIFKGTSGNFTPFRSNTVKGAAVPVLAHRKLLFVVAGVGVTPALAALDGLAATSSSANVAILFTGRNDDHKTLLSLPAPATVTHLALFKTKGDIDAETLPKSAVVAKRRMDKEDLAQVEGIAEREVFVCGPPGFMESTTKWLVELGVSVEQIHKEDFYF